MNAFDRWPRLHPHTPPSGWEDLERVPPPSHPMHAPASFQFPKLPRDYHGTTRLWNALAILKVFTPAQLARLDPRAALIEPQIGPRTVGEIARLRRHVLEAARAQQQPPEEPQAVTLEYDAQGVPHVRLGLADGAVLDLPLQVAELVGVLARAHRIGAEHRAAPG